MPVQSLIRWSRLTLQLGLSAFQVMSQVLVEPLPQKRICIGWSSGQDMFEFRGKGVFWVSD